MTKGWHAAAITVPVTAATLMLATTWAASATPPGTALPSDPSASTVQALQDAVKGERADLMRLQRAIDQAKANLQAQRQAAAAAPAVPSTSGGSPQQPSGGSSTTQAQPAPAPPPPPPPPDTTTSGS